jgi:hypothetical protein
MFSGSSILFLAVGAGWLLMLRRFVAFRMRNDFWGMLAAFSVMPVLGVLIVWPDCPERYLAVALAPAFLMVQYSLFLATVREAEKLRALRREIPRWRLLTGTPPKDFERAAVLSMFKDRRLSLRTLFTAACVAAAVLFYAVVCFGWNSIVILAVFFWAFMALYQFSFNPDNQ